MILSQVAVPKKILRMSENTPDVDETVVIRANADPDLDSTMLSSRNADPDVTRFTPDGALLDFEVEDESQPVIRKERESSKRMGGAALVSQGRSAYDPGVEGIETIDYQVRGEPVETQAETRWQSAADVYSGPYPFEPPVDRARGPIIVFLSSLAAVTVLAVTVLILIFTGTI